MSISTEELYDELMTEEPSAAILAQRRRDIIIVRATLEASDRPYAQEALASFNRLHPEVTT